MQNRCVPGIAAPIRVGGDGVGVTSPSAQNASLKTGWTSSFNDSRTSQAGYDVFDTIGAPSICADCAFHAWFVLGPQVADWRGLDLAKQPVRAWKKDAVVAEGSGANALGDPRIALTWLANHLNARGLALKAGEVITTGTCVKPVDVIGGDTVVMDYAALGKMSAGFD